MENIKTSYYHRKLWFLLCCILTQRLRWNYSCSWMISRLSEKKTWRYVPGTCQYIRKEPEARDLPSMVHRHNTKSCTETHANTFVDIFFHEWVKSETLWNYFSSEKANLDPESIFMYSYAMFLSRDRSSKQTRVSGLCIIVHSDRSVVDLWQCVVCKMEQYNLWKLSVSRQVYRYYPLFDKVYSVCLI